MPTALKVVVAVNVVSVTAIALLALIAGGQLLPGAYSSDEGHEIKLVPIQPDEPTVREEIARPVQRAAIPAEYRTPDPAPSPWIVQPDGSVRFIRNE